jgi:hypothetical protein
MAVEVDNNMAAEEPLPAGSFSAWLAGMERALEGEASSDVPCGDCTGCCRSSQFVHIGPDEVDTVAHIPAALLFPAPRMPRGNVLLGYDEQGCCPMLVDGRCSIYEHRPRTCRTYDCRVFPASGVEIEDDGDKGPIAERARRWTFDVAQSDDRVRHLAVRAAASFVDAHPEVLPEGAPRPTATQRAVMAVRAHRAFLGRDGETGDLVAVDPDPGTVRVALGRRR